MHACVHMCVFVYMYIHVPVSVGVCIYQSTVISTTLINPSHTGQCSEDLAQGCSHEPVGDCEYVPGTANVDISLFTV